MPDIPWNTLAEGLMNTSRVRHAREVTPTAVYTGMRARAPFGENGEVALGGQAALEKYGVKDRSPSAWLSLGTTMSPEVPQKFTVGERDSLLDDAGGITGVDSNGQLAIHVKRDNPSLTKAGVLAHEIEHAKEWPHTGAKSSTSRFDENNLSQMDARVGSHFRGSPNLTVDLPLEQFYKEQQLLGGQVPEEGQKRYQRRLFANPGALPLSGANTQDLQDTLTQLLRK